MLCCAWPWLKNEPEFEAPQKANRQCFAAWEAKKPSWPLLKNKLCVPVWSEVLSAGGGGVTRAGVEA